MRAIMIVIAAVLMLVACGSDVSEPEDNTVSGHFLVETVGGQPEDINISYGIDEEPTYVDTVTALYQIDFEADSSLSLSCSTPQYVYVKIYIVLPDTTISTAGTNFIYIVHEW